MWRVKIHDDRGRAVRLRRFGPMPPKIASWRTAGGVLSATLSPAGMLTILFVGIIAMMVALTAIFGPVVIAIAMFSPVVASLVILGANWAISVGGAARRRGERIRDAMLRRRRCPACAYSLDGLDTDPDGCVRCPECGAGWLLQRPVLATGIVIRNF